MRRPITVAATALLAALVLAGCTAPNQTAPVTGAPSSSVPAPSASVEATPDAESKRPTCESLISAALVESFSSLGWTVEEETFRIAGVEHTDGILCTWADYTLGGEQMQMFGWAPLDPEDADDAISSLVADGWISESAPGGNYVTENPETVNPARADAEGFGWTYLFGDGWVTLADTKESLILINRPAP